MGGVRSKQPSKLVGREAGGSHDHGHCIRIDRIVPWDGQNAAAIGHHNVFPLAYNSEARPLERPNRALVRDAGDGH